MTIKIASLTTENVKRVKSVHIEPSPNGLTIIGGNNNNGKTSILDSIAWALGGNKYRPSKAQREGSVVPPTINLKLSNGLIVERKGKNSDLKVTDPTGNKAGQNLLDSFVEELAINLPKFINSSDKEKANTLLEIIGVGQQLYELECQEKEKYNMRRSIGQIADQKEKFAKEQPFYPEAPKTLVSITDLITQQQDILAKNGENQRKRDMTDQLHRQATQLMAEIERQEATLANLKEQYQSVLRDYDVAQKTSEELEESIANIEAINIKVRANLDREKAEQDAAEYRTQYSSLTTEIESLRKQRMDLLQNADLPLEGLSVEDGELLYNGQRWDNMSGSQQLMVSTAIVRKLKPECGFVLIDKLEQMDMQTLNEFGSWLEQEGLQAIATRVSTGDECSIIIEDGYVKNSESVPAAPPTPKWEAGKF